MNDFQDSDEQIAIPILEMDPNGYARQARRLQELRQTRDNEAVRVALDGVREAARSQKNMMPSLLEAAHAYATLQEIMDVMRDEFGTYIEDSVF